MKRRRSQRPSRSAGRRSIGRWKLADPTWRCSPQEGVRWVSILSPTAWQHVLNTGQPGRLLGSRQEKRQASRAMEVGDLLRRDFQGGCPCSWILPNRARGPEGRKRRARRVVQEALHSRLTARWNASRLPLAGARTPCRCRFSRGNRASL